MNAPASPMAFRPQKRREPGTTKALFAAMAEEAGGVERAGFLIGVSRTQAYAFSDPAEGERNVSLDQARRLAAATASAAFADDAAALAGGFFCPGGAEGSVADLSSRGALTFGQFSAQMIAAMQDGGLSALERQGLLSDLNNVIGALASCRAKLLAELRGDKP